MLKVFTVYDSKSETYQTPFCMLNTAAAIRGFITILNDPQSPHSMYPGDFTLFEMGTFDETTGKLVVYDSFENLGLGSHLQPKGSLVMSLQNEIARLRNPVSNNIDGVTN